MKIYCYTGSKVSSTFYDAYFLNKYSKKHKYVLCSKYDPPSNTKSVILFTDPGAFCQYYQSFKDYPNKIICWWHGNKHTPNEGVQRRIKIAKEWLPKCKAIIVSCDYGYNSVKSLGVAEKNIYKIPLGVDLSLFYPLINKDEIRNRFKVPKDSFCIGSFQRDTDKKGGPKIIKGPDIFIDVIRILKEKIPNLFVLLSGRRRTYVQKHLKKLYVNHRIKYLQDYLDMGSMYNALDCYLLTSREEGGPKALMESIACNIPIVSTNCGMASDVIINGINGYMCDINIDHLVEKVIDVYNGKISGDIRLTVDKFDYNNIVTLYDNFIDIILK